MSRALKYVYRQRTNELTIRREKRGRTFTTTDEALWRAIAKLKLDRFYSHRIAIRLARHSGETQFWATIFPKEKIVLNKLVLDSLSTNRESLRRGTDMIQQAYEDARKMGCTKIETDITILNPQFAKRVGLTIKEVIYRGKEKLYKYEGVL